MNVWVCEFVCAANGWFCLLLRLLCKVIKGSYYFGHTNKHTYIYTVICVLIVHLICCDSFDGGKCLASRVAPTKQALMATCRIWVTAPLLVERLLQRAKMLLCKNEAHNFIAIFIYDFSGAGVGVGVGGKAAWLVGKAARQGCKLDAWCEFNWQGFALEA